MKIPYSQLRFNAADEPRPLTRSLVRGWRDAWEQKYLPLYFVQLPQWNSYAWTYLREEQRRIRGALDGLRDHDRQVVLLAASGLSGSELADRMGRSDSATRTLLCRARGRLRALLVEPEGSLGVPA